MDDCLIIGGGVVGLSLAYELAQNGMQVRIVDRAEFGREASWAGAGILPPAGDGGAFHSVDKLRALSHRLHSEWAARLHEETGVDTGFRRCGGIYVARSQGEAAALGGFVGLLSGEGIDVVRLTHGELAEFEPALQPLVECGSLRAAYFVRDECQLRNPDHLKALKQACQRQGVTLVPHTEIMQITVNNGEAVAYGSSGPFHAARICITSGAWTANLLRQLSLPTGIMPVRGQMVMFRTSRPLVQRIINEGPRYLVPRDDGRLLAGSTEDEVGFDKRTTSDGVNELREFAGALIESLRTASVERTWAGLRPGSFDGFPYLGRLPEVSNAFVAAGHFRSGLSLSTGTAVVMGRLIRGLDPGIDLTPFRVGRG